MMVWDVAGWSCAGETVSGDGCLVEQLPDGVAVAVVDGLGHGTEAAEARSVALACFEQNVSHPVPEIFNACHRAMRKTRGAAMCIATFTGDTLRWGSVGNVEGILLHGSLRRYVLAQAGVVGFQLPRMIRLQENKLSDGDKIVIFSDGIRQPGFGDLASTATPTDVAQQTLMHYGVRTDDALICVLQYTNEEE